MKKHKLITISTIAILAGNFIGFTKTVHAADITTQDVISSTNSEKNTTTITDTKKVKNTWGYPFAVQKKKGVRPMYNSQTFGMTNYARSLNPLSYFHDGWDFGVSEVGKNSTVKAIHPGTVKEVRYGAGLGWYAWVISDDGYVEIYQEGFNSRKDISVKAGQKVKTGQKIGKLTGTHLHLGLTKTTKKYINTQGFPCNNWYRNVGTWLNPVSMIEKHVNK
ncbi:M23 family metallopeptidase [Lactobacillus sp. LL6]|uniref:M23 family metallopeptidase n=1 Tax=Lactobacillus sp. LL6 TaxID=2596827 RepID=UPI0011871E58|nr:M23 family metallopeptidase [Lactobacillus sp. LL6]TSO26374.1 M23 family metallopeptidase [Lactobacillus sp. LL6]